MGINIVELAENKNDYLKKNFSLQCPLCNEKWYSPFDRLYILAYDYCVECDERQSDPLEAERKQLNILEVV